MAVLICSAVAAGCSTAASLFPESSDSASSDEAFRSPADGRVLGGRAKGRYEAGSQVASNGQGAAGVAAYQRDQPPPDTASSSDKSALPGMANRWRPTARVGDHDGDGVVDVQDECPETAAFVTVDRVGCGLFDATLDEVVFSSGSRWLSETARGRLSRLAETLLAFPESRVQVRAHTDSSGSAAANLTLSAQRAESVVQYLQSRGVHARQLQAVGMGEAVPVASNDDAEGQRQNRRVDIVTLPDQDAGELPSPVKPARAITLLAEASGSKTRDIPATAVDKSARAPAAKEPALKAAKPNLKVRERANPPVMPLPQPGFAPGVSISGVVEGLSFAAGSTEIQDDAYPVLDQITTTLQDNPQVSIVVMAHTDDSGDASNNLELSRQRAQSVVGYLIDQGIAAERLDAEGYGELLPLVQNVTDKDRARNRRVEIRIQRQ